MGDVSEFLVSVGVSKDVASGIDKANSVIGVASGVWSGIQSGIGVLQALGILQKSTTTLDDLKSELDALKNLLTAGFEDLKQAIILQDWTSKAITISDKYSSAISAFEDATGYSLSPDDPVEVGVYGNALSASLKAANDLMPPQKDFSASLWSRLTDDRMFYSDPWNGIMGNTVSNNPIRETTEYRLQLTAFCAAVASRMGVLAFKASSPSNVALLLSDALRFADALENLHNLLILSFERGRMPTSNEFRHILTLCDPWAWSATAANISAQVYSTTPGGTWLQAGLVCGAVDRTTGLRVLKNFAEWHEIQVPFGPLLKLPENGDEPLIVTVEYGDFVQHPIVIVPDFTTDQAGFEVGYKLFELQFELRQLGARYELYIESGLAAAWELIQRLRSLASEAPLLPSEISNISFQNINSLCVNSGYTGPTTLRSVSAFLNRPYSVLSLCFSANGLGHPYTSPFGGARDFGTGGFGVPWPY